MDKAKAVADTKRKLEASWKRMNETLAKVAPLDEDKLADAKRQGQAQFDSIKIMVADLQCAVDQDNEGGADETEAPRRRIEEDALSVQVRSGWYQPGASKEDRAPEEYEILLCTGGPACRIVGELDDYCQPTSAQLEVQDWFQPWTEYHPINPADHTFSSRIDTKAEETLLAYARCFYFGEG